MKILNETVTRRQFFKKIGALIFSFFIAGNKYRNSSKVFAAITGQKDIPVRPLGKTGVNISSFGLGGEGVLRTYGRMKEAVAVIHKALELGVKYFDTAPAYSQSQDYLGEGLKGSRRNIFLASKTHERSRDGSLQLLEDSLKRLRTDYLNLWQIHDVRTKDDINRIFSDNGAIKALEEAKSQGLVKFAGITGHYDPLILKEAIERYPFDTIMIPLNPADKHYNSFIEQLLSVVEKKKMGIIAMKVYARGKIFRKGGIETPEEALSYALSFPVGTAIIGCSTPAEVEENARIAREFKPLSKEEIERLESAVESYSYFGNFYKK